MASAGGLKPRDIVTLEAIDNAFALDIAMGGSTNTVLHTLAIATEAGIDYPLERINELSARVPYLCKVSPATYEVHIEDVHAAGGVMAILKELSRKEGTLHPDCLTVTGKTHRRALGGGREPEPRGHPPGGGPVRRDRRPGDAVRQPGAQRGGR